MQLYVWNHMYLTSYLLLVTYYTMIEDFISAEYLYILYDLLILYLFLKWKIPMLNCLQFRSPLYSHISHHNGWKIWRYASFQHRKFCHYMNKPERGREGGILSSYTDHNNCIAPPGATSATWRPELKTREITKCTCRVLGGRKSGSVLYLCRRLYSYRNIWLEDQEDNWVVSLNLLHYTLHIFHI